jgi:hypothetical protein
VLNFQKNHDLHTSDHEIGIVTAKVGVRLLIPNFTQFTVYICRDRSDVVYVEMQVNGVAVSNKYIIAQTYLHCSM